MTSAGLSILAALALAALVIGVLCALTLVPLVATLGLVERRGLGTVRWGLASALCSAVGLGVAALALRHGLGPVPVLLGVVATWAAPLALLLLGGAGGRLAGVRGRHE